MYSPKIYDSHLIELYHDWFIDCMDGVVFFGDGHFGVAKKLFKNTGVKFHTPVAKPKKPELNEDGEDLVKVSQKEEKWNDDLAHVRARVEKNFAWCKNTFESLSKP